MFGPTVARLQEDSLRVSQDKNLRDKLQGEKFVKHLFVMNLFDAQVKLIIWYTMWYGKSVMSDSKVCEILVIHIFTFNLLRNGKKCFVTETYSSHFCTVQLLFSLL